MELTMKRTLRNLCIFLASVSGALFVYRMIQRHKGPLVRVVVFHDVTDSAWFRTLLVHMKNHYHVISPTDFLTRTFDRTKINILVTFDDGYTSWNTVCLPILRELEVKALFFVNSGLLDLHADDTSRRAYLQKNLLLKGEHETMSWDDLSVLSESGHTIGGHSRTHARLSELSKGEVKDEVSDDKGRIEEMVHTKLIHFAYPFGNTGDFTRETILAVEDAGYTHTFSTESSFAHTEQTTNAIPRLCIEDGLRKKELSRWIEGGYDMYTKLKNICAR
jgi:peptidoglycan/xylan/chitin deacetylase (PgdA/CDA1 family)